MPQILNHAVGLIGFGLMGFTWRPTPTPTEEAVEVLHETIKAGCTLWSGAEFYGPPQHNSVTLFKAYFTKYPEDASKVTLVIKGGVDPVTMKPMGSVDDLSASVDRIITGLQGIDNLNIVFGIGRRDPTNPLDEALKAIQKNYIDTGKISGVSLSECSPETIREASKHVKVALAEVELSIFTPDILTNGVAAACKEFDIPVMAYSPIGRGMLTGQMRQAADVAYLGRLSGFPRLQDEAIKHNLKLVDQLEALAKKKGCTSTQLAINWVRTVGEQSQLPSIIPIPGTTKVERLRENAKIVQLDADDLKAIEDLVEGFEIQGRRYPNGVPIEL